MKISTLGSSSSSSNFKKSRNAYRPFDVLDLIQPVPDDFFVEEDAYYSRRFKKKKDGAIEKDYSSSLFQQLSYIKQPFNIK